MMTRAEIIGKTRDFIRTRFEQEGSGHDWWHIHRVWKMSVLIASDEGGDLFLVKMAALLHDLDDWKMNGSEGQEQTKRWLTEMDVTEDEAFRILEIIRQVSFRGAGSETPASSTEAKIVRDADRLDAMGAIGVARAFSYGGSRGRLIYHPDIGPEMHIDFERYKKSRGPTVNHFYEKLLLLKGRMQTDRGKKLAESRHQFLLLFLEQFFREWEGKI